MKLKENLTPNTTSNPQPLQNPGTHLPRPFPRQNPRLEPRVALERCGCLDSKSPPKGISSLDGCGGPPGETLCGILSLALEKEEKEWHKGPNNFGPNMLRVKQEVVFGPLTLGLHPKPFLDGGSQVLPFGTTSYKNRDLEFLSGHHKIRAYQSPGRNQDLSWR